MHSGRKKGRKKERERKRERKLRKVLSQPRALHFPRRKEEEILFFFCTGKEKKNPAIYRLTANRRKDFFRITPILLVAENTGMEADLSISRRPILK